MKDFIVELARGSSVRLLENPVWDAFYDNRNTPHVTLKVPVVLYTFLAATFLRRFVQNLKCGFVLTCTWSLFMRESRQHIPLTLTLILVYLCCCIFLAATFLRRFVQNLKCGFVLTCTWSLCMRESRQHIPLTLTLILV